MFNKINFFLNFYEENLRRIYIYLFCNIEEAGKKDILIKNSVYFFIEKDNAMLQLVYRGDKKIKFFYEE